MSDVTEISVYYSTFFDKQLISTEFRLEISEVCVAIAFSFKSCKMYSSVER